MDMPGVTTSQMTDQEGIGKLISHLASLGIFVNEMKRDVGIDLTCELVRDGECSGIGFLAQVKSTRPKRKWKRTSPRLKPTTLRFLREKARLQPVYVILVDLTHDSYHFQLVPPPDEPMGRSLSVSACQHIDGSFKSHVWDTHQRIVASVLSNAKLVGNGYIKQFTAEASRGALFDTIYRNAFLLSGRQLQTGDYEWAEKATDIGLILEPNRSNFLYAKAVCAGIRGGEEAADFAKRAQEAILSDKNKEIIGDSWFRWIVLECDAILSHFGGAGNQAAMLQSMLQRRMSDFSKDFGECELGRFISQAQDRPWGPLLSPMPVS